MSEIAHGGRLGEAQKMFPHAPGPLLDLSTGINPVPYPLPDLPATCFTRLPERDDVTALEETAAAAYGVADAACVVAAPGTQILIELLPRVWPQRDIAVLGPTYAEHAQAWARSGCTVQMVSAFAELDEAASAVLCNPNNPDGRRVAPVDILGLADHMARRGGLLIVDEAFADLEDGVSVASALPHPALVVLRSFGKTYGLAGLRLGFALAAPDRAASIRAALGPWAVSGPAIAVGLVALADADWRHATASRLDADANALDSALRAAGLTVIGGTRLFRLAQSETADKTFIRLGEAGILVRRFAEQPDRLRFGLSPDEAGLNRLRAALPPHASA